MSALITADTMKLLGTLKGKRLNYLEYLVEGRRELAYGMLHIYLPKKCIKVTCMQEPLLFYDELEDVAVFRCVEVDPKDPLYYHEESLRRNCRYLVNERVKGVEVVREHVTDLGDGATFSMDVTIAMRTKWRTISLSREGYDDEILDIYYDDPPNADTATIQPMEKTTLVRGVDSTRVAVEREVIVL